MVCEYDIIPMHSKQERSGWTASILYAVPPLSDRQVDAFPGSRVTA